MQLFNFAFQGDQRGVILARNFRLQCFERDARGFLFRNLFTAPRPAPVLSVIEDDRDGKIFGVVRSARFDETILRRDLQLALTQFLQHTFRVAVKAQRVHAFRFSREKAQNEIARGGKSLIEIQRADQALRTRPRGEARVRVRGRLLRRATSTRYCGKPKSIAKRASVSPLTSAARRDVRSPSLISGKR